MRNASFGATLGFLFLIAAGAPTAGAQLAADARAGVSLAAEPAPADSVRRVGAGERFAVSVLLPAYFWSVGAFAGALVTGGAGECFGEGCEEHRRDRRAAVVEGFAVGGGATVALILAGPKKYHPRCGYRARLARATAGAVVGTAPGLAYGALEGHGIASVYGTGAGQLVGSLVALRACR